MQIIFRVWLHIHFRTRVLWLQQVLELGQLIKTRKITSEELTGIFIRRLKR